MIFMLSIWCNASDIWQTCMKNATVYVARVPNLSRINPHVTRPNALATAPRGKDYDIASTDESWIDIVH